jgi:NADH-quinone oxidoreductase subunit L
MHLQNFPLLFLIPTLPLIGAAYCAFLGLRMQRRFGESGVHLPAIILPWISFAISLIAFLTLAGAGPKAAMVQRLWSWFHVGTLEVELAFLMDPLSGVMCLIVTFVGSLIHVYSRGYMKGDPSYWRFFSHLNLFMFAMLVLVLGDNFLVMFVGWEGVGLCSYLLIGFWYRERKNAVAGMKAFVVNRIGDFGFSLGLFLLFWGLAAGAPNGLGHAGLSHDPQPARLTAGESTGTIAGQAAGHDSAPVAGEEPDRGTGHGESQHASLATSVTFREVEEIVEDPARREGLISQKVLGINLLTLVCLLLFLGAAGKSAQLPLYVWLPDAMAGPTPVSALIHAATMVTAGVYMVARLHFLFASSAAAMTVVATVGALTGLYAATIGLFQHDIKKVLAYSTVSQLGFMFLAVGVGAYWVGIFHLMTHAFFKACLFLGSGSVILGCHHEQDMRKMGGLRKLMPVTAVTYFVSCAAIAGFPFFAGFFSKDEILWKAFDSGNMLLPGGGITLWAIAAVAALCTSFYMFRSYYMTFSGAYRGGAGHGANHANTAHDAHGSAGHAALPHESPRSITVVLTILGALAVVGGFIGLPVLWGLPNLFERWLEPVFESSAAFVRSAGHGHGAEWGLMGLSVVIAFSGFFLARALYRDAKSPVPGRLLASTNPLVRGFHRVVYNKYYVDEAYQATFVNGTVGLSSLLAWIDREGVDGVVNLVGRIGRVLSTWQGLFDRYVVDGLVNLVGLVIIGAGRSVRRIQTGRIQNYVLGLTAGAVAVVVLGFLLAR